MKQELIVLTVATIKNRQAHALIVPRDETVERTVLLILPRWSDLSFHVANMPRDLTYWYPKEIQGMAELAARWSIPPERQWIEMGAVKPILGHIMGVLKPARLYGVTYSYPSLEFPSISLKKKGPLLSLQRFGKRKFLRLHRLWKRFRKIERSLTWLQSQGLISL